MSSNKNNKAAAYEDLSGPSAPPPKKESTEQYFKRRENEMEETRGVFMKEGFKGGIIFTAVTSGCILGASLISPRFRQTLSWANRTFIISSGFVAGFWIYGETASHQFIHDRLAKEMDDYHKISNKNLYFVLLDLVVIIIYFATLLY
ncbi:hypothetical protein DFA_00432 [Cavenderia fasciculata]|uniref:Transmembrane protein n=1 Tax=Cavenderia fasciculata TaxID=261658 RepID=F4PRS2_CACFS|nr:uncharacterized protein DFA_00432 [Cavenderia fasciculata]EGG20571.1 hypothetical protein DFA_00432 [Cavenderia fasciculata]|eukprot:XP_004358421.1 hypothetical protein DFA_00432 [Cavenderia fasciculata]